MWFFFTAAYIEHFCHAVLTYNTNFQVILAGAVKIADAVDRCRTSVVVHCSDGWDRTSQVSIHASILYSDLYEIATSSLVLLCFYLFYFYRFIGAECGKVFFSLNR